MKDPQDMTMDELRQAVIDENQAVLDNDIKQKANGFTHRVTYSARPSATYPNIDGYNIRADSYFGSDPRELTRDMDSKGAWSTWQEIKALSNNDYKIHEL